jgi:hypothetical protein
MGYRRKILVLLMVPNQETLKHYESNEIWVRVEPGYDEQEASRYLYQS